MKLKVTDTDEYVSVSLMDGCVLAGSAEMDLMGDNWWLSRIVLKHKYRRQGYGTKIINELKRYTSGLKIVVMPGGYDLTKDEQIAFYKSCGFQTIDEHTLEYK